MFGIFKKALSKTIENIASVIPEKKRKLNLI